MHINQRKEQFSIAYVRAVASAAGFAAYKPEVDDDSIDLGLAASGDLGTIRSPKLDLQVKCTARDVLEDSSLTYPLPRKNYDDLRAQNVLVPRILVIVLVPDSLEDWLTHSEDNLLLRHCGYWLSLRGFAESENINTVSVTVPRNNQFTVAALTTMMTTIANGGLP